MSTSFERTFGVGRCHKRVLYKHENDEVFQVHHRHQIAVWFENKENKLTINNQDGLRLQHHSMEKEKYVQSIQII